MKLSPHAALGSVVVLLTPPLLAAVAGVDVLGDVPRAHVRRLAAARDESTGARIAGVEERLGVPTFVFTAARGTGVLAPLAGAPDAPRAEAQARRILADHAHLWNLSRPDLDRMVLKHLHDTGAGPIVASFRSLVDGVEVFRDEMHVGMARDLSPVAISGYLPPVAALARAGGFRLDRREAVAAAFRDLTGAALDPGDLVSDGEDGAYERLSWRPAPSAERFAADVRVKRVWFHLPDQLVPGFYVDMRVGDVSSNEADYVAWVISAVNGAVLLRKDLTASDSFVYRVWADTTGIKAPYISPAGKAGSPHPTGLPDGWQATLVPPNLVTLQNGPIPTNDPWLLAGATQTNGNNVDAYADLNPPDGYSAGDFRATTTSAGAFDRTFDTSASPGATRDQQMAVVTQLFYDVNFFHDWYYASGFTEAAGNAQVSNYARGGAQGDPIHAEAQDYSGRNNATMSTPPDGASPRMQMYVFSGNGPYGVTVNAPVSVAGTLSSARAVFGPQAFRVTGGAVFVENVGNLHDACSPPTNAAALAGRVALADRSTCAPVVLVKNAQSAGALGVLVMDDGHGLATMGGTDPAITIPAMMVSQSDGAALKAASGVDLTLWREAATDRDGALDNEIVAHEWGHYISNRLVGDAMGLSTPMASGLGEGWGDFHAQLLTVKEADGALPQNVGWSGAYSNGGYVMSGYGDRGLPNQGYYFGPRRVPYSTDFGKDPLTFRHIEEGVPLPSTAPLAFGANGVGNSYTHNSGEVWATMLWESYAALLNDSRFTFTQAQNRMKDILVAAYKLTPLNPTLLEARDALLAAALAFDVRDCAAIAQAFARRGAGSRAVAPDRYDKTNSGVVESYLASGDVALVSYALNDDVLSCDMDGYLDDGETGRLTFVFKNAGTGPAAGVTVSVTSSTPGVSVGGIPLLGLPVLEPLQTATLTVPVTLASPSVAELALTAVVNEPSSDEPLVLPFTFRANADEAAGQSATDDVEALHPLWIPSGVWKRVAISTFDHRWSAPDAGHSSEAALVSPAFDVTGDFRVTFRHRYQFPTDTAPTGKTLYRDGGVVEASTDGGSTWADVTSFAGGVAAYDERIYALAENPLGARLAFAGTSRGWPALAATTADFGSSLAGKSAKVRFRMGVSNFKSAPGWEIDDIAFTGTSSKPFPTVVAHRSQCLPATTISLDAAPRTPTFGDPVTLAATAPGAAGAAITFLDGAEAIGAVAADAAGRATLRTSTLAVGTHAFTAFRSGTATAQPATSAPVTVTVAHASGAVASSSFVPIVLDVDNGSAHYVSELTLTNPGTLPVTASLAYTASIGSGSGTATLVLAPGEQRILPDALTTLRIAGLAIPFSSAGSQGGTLAVSFDNATSGALPAATVRTGALTAAPQPAGFAGLAYGGLSSGDAITASAAVYGLRASASDRSHVAVYNTGSVPVTVKLTVFSGAADGRTVVVDGGKTLAPGAWFQYSFLLDNAGFGTSGITTGWAIVERVSADGSFGAYGVINDNTTNDGSFIPPVPSTSGGSGITLPVLVETPAFRSELVLTNRGPGGAALTLSYRESNTPASGAGGSVVVTLAPGEQRIIPEAIDYLRTHGASIGAKDAASYVGALRVTIPNGIAPTAVFVGARTASQSPAGGQFGLFTPGVYAGQEASNSAALYGLRVDANNRSNVAVVNAGSDAAGPVTLSIQAYEGVHGTAAGSPTVVTLAPGQWAQFGSILSGAGLANGWVVLTRRSGNAPWIVYAVINDGGAPGERTGDGAYLPMFR